MKVENAPPEASLALETGLEVKHNNRNLKTKPRKRVMKEKENFDNEERGESSHKKTGTIGVISIKSITGMLGSEYYRKLLTGIKESCELAGQDLIISCQEDSKADGSYLRLYYEDKVDGIIFVSFNHRVKELECLEESTVPCILISNTPIELEEADKIKQESYELMYKSTVKLIGDGHKKLAFIKGPTGLYDAEKCYQGFLAALKEQGLNPDEKFIYEGSFDSDIAEAVLSEIGKAKDGPTALLCSNDLLALGVLGEAGKRGLNIPGELQVVGCKKLTPPIGSALKALGSQSAELLLSQINNPEQKPASRIVRLDIPANI